MSQRMVTVKWTDVVTEEYAAEIPLADFLAAANEDLDGGEPFTEEDVRDICLPDGDVSSFLADRCVDGNLVGCFTQRSIDEISNQEDGDVQEADMAGDGDGRVVAGSGDSGAGSGDC